MGDEALLVEAAEISATERRDRPTLAVLVYSRRVLIAHGLARRAAEAVSRRA